VEEHSKSGKASRDYIRDQQQQDENTQVYSYELLRILRDGPPPEAFVEEHSKRGNALKNYMRDQEQQQ
jgi:hypothetical protein